MDRQPLEERLRALALPDPPGEVGAELMRRAETRRPARRRGQPAWRLGLVFLLALVTTAGVTALLTQDSRAVSSDRTVAADFLGCPPSDLRKPASGPTPQAVDGPEGSWWVRADGAAPARVELLVNTDLGYVRYAHWTSGPGPEASPREGERRFLTPESALEKARSFVSAHCPFWVPQDRETPPELRDYRSPPLYEVQWSGDGPEEFRHLLTVGVSAVSGDVVMYRASVLPQDPPGAVPVLVTREQAVALVTARVTQFWPDMLPPFTVSVRLLTTRSPYAPPGRPAYYVQVRGFYPGPHGTRGDYVDGCGVDANTGAVLRERSPDRAHGPDPTVPKLSADAALERARAALPADLTSPRLTLDVFTRVSPVAPVGRLVYPVRVSGERPSATNPEEKVPWAMTWAVDAADGRIYGLGDRPLPDLPAAARN